MNDGADECFAEARTNLEQAERLFNESQGRDLDRVNAVVGIANGWTALGVALWTPPELLQHVAHTGPSVSRSSFAERLGTHRFGLGASMCPACLMTEEQARRAAERGDKCKPGDHWRGPIPLLPDHAHSPDCAHQWIGPTEPCRACRQTQERNQERCPVPCPEPGDWWVHHGKTRTIG